MIPFEHGTLQTVFVEPDDFTRKDAKTTKFAAVIEDTDESWYNQTAQNVEDELTTVKVLNQVPE
jgi:hypothetical protein